MKTTTIAGQVDTTRKIMEALRQINPELDIRGITQEVVNAKMERYYTIVNLLDGIDAQGTTLMNERNLIISFFRQLPVSTREVIAGKYGKDSNEYELVGGTRKSEIQRGGRSKGPKAAKTPKAAKMTKPADENGAS